MQAAQGKEDGQRANPNRQIRNQKPRPVDDRSIENHVRAPSFINLTPLGKMSEGTKVADVVGILGSIDIVLGETDR